MPHLQSSVQLPGILAMINLFSKILTIFVGLVVVLVSGCQAGSEPALPVEATPALPAPVAAPTGQPDPPPSPPPSERVVDLGQARPGKLSGIVFYPPRETLFAVSDNGQVIELNTDGEPVQKKSVRKKADFEGITYSPVTGMLYVAIEGDETILEVDPDTLEPGRDIPIERQFEGEMLLSPEGNGIEGITFVPAADNAGPGSFYLVNQSEELGGADPSIVFEVEVDDEAGEPQARILRYFSVGITDLSGIHYVPASRCLLIVSDDNNVLLEVSLDGQVLETYMLPGEKQEGVTMDGHGSVYVAQDSKEALIRLTWLESAKPGQ